jgi:hypothetical protein
VEGVVTGAGALLSPPPQPTTARESVRNMALRTIFFTWNYSSIVVDSIETEPSGHMSDRLLSGNPAIRTIEHLTQ